MTESPVLSVIIPVYNEFATISRALGTVLDALPEVPKQIVIVDDGSIDGTKQWLRSTFPDGISRVSGGGARNGELVLSPEDPAKTSHEIRIIYHETNGGKGKAIRTGIAGSSGDVIVIQDADLEYDPRDWGRMYDLIAHRRIADVVFGCRFYGLPHRSLFFVHFLANRLISFLFNLLYNQTLMDIEVCYKMMRRDVLEGMALVSDDFGIEVELAAKIAKARHWRIYEVGISYFGRTYDEGKKVNWRDGVLALWYLLKFRFV